jgi:Ca2+-binding RTX toxin-like protein
MTTLNVSSPAGFNSNNFFIPTLNDATNVRFEGLTSTTGNPLLGEYVNNYTTLAFEANGYTYRYSGNWTTTENRLIAVGSIAASGAYTGVEVSQNGSTIAQYSGGPALNVDFGSSGNIPLLQLVGNLLSLLLGIQPSGSGAYANLNTAVTPDVASLAFAGDDSMMGSAGADKLVSYAGNDMLRGLDGNDILDGGLGNDTMYGDVGDDVYYVDSTGDQVIEYGSQGVDLVNSTISYALTSHVENLQLRGRYDIKGVGNEMNNTIGGNIGDNVIDGKAGADIMVGNGGDDTYYVENIGDQVIESANEGIDLVNSWLSYQLTNNVENLQLRGELDINGTGNDLSNTIAGNNGNNILNGGNGNDTLNGGLGNDTLIGGAGNDILNGGTNNDQIDGGLGNDTLTGGANVDFFNFTTALGATNIDDITDFLAVSDTIGLSKAIFTAFSGAVGTTIGAAAFHVGVSAHDGDDRIIYDQNSGTIYYDADGNGAGAAIAFATLDTKPTITQADFVLIA